MPEIIEHHNGLRIGDRVIVPPRTALLALPAPGGPGVVIALRGGDELDVLLDSGEHRTPASYFVEREGWLDRLSAND